MADETAQGIANVGALTDMQRKTAAYNALNAAYGPAIAYSPENAFNAAKASVAQQTIPTQVGQEQANLQQTQQGNVTAKTQFDREQAYRAAGMLAASADPQTGAISGDLFDQTISAHPDQYGMTPDMVAAFRARATAPGGADFMSHVQQQIIGPQQMVGAPMVANTPNGPEVIRFGKNGGMSTTQLGPGVTPVAQEKVDTANAALAERKKQDAYLQAHGWTTAKIAEFRASTGANNSLYGAGGATLPGVPGAGGGNTLPPPSTDLIGAGNPPGSKTAGQPAPKASVIDTLPIKGQVQVRSQAQQIVNNQTTFDQAMRVADSMDKQISPWSTGPGSKIALPGSVQNDLRRNAQTLQAAAAQAVLTGMKNAQGSTGIGRILQAEYKNFTSVYGNLETDQSAAQFKQHLGFLRDSLTRIITTQRSAFQAQWKQSPEGAIGMPERSTGPQASAQDLVDELARRGIVKK